MGKVLLQEKKNIYEILENEARDLDGFLVILKADLLKVWGYTVGLSFVFENSGWDAVDGVWVHVSG